MSGEINPRECPQEIDAPIPILFWEPLEFITAIALLGIGVALDMLPMGLIGCVVVLRYAKQMRRGAKANAAQHMLWAFGSPFVDPAMKWFPPAELTDFYD